MDWKGLNQTLNADFKGQKFFKKLSPSPRPSPWEANADEDTQNNVYFGKKKTEKTLIGRPPEYFVIPSAEDIQSITKAQYWTTTTITNTELNSVLFYRARLNTGRIARTKHYEFHSNKWLGKCLGVTPRTVFTYVELEELHKQERFTYVETITEKNVASLKYKDYPDFYLLMTAGGRKYPVNYRAARALLGRKHKALTIVRQGSNYYSVEEASLKSQIDELQEKRFSADWDDLIKQHQDGFVSGGINRQEKANPDADAQIQDYWQKLKDEQSRAFDSLNNTGTPSPNQDLPEQESDEEQLDRIYLKAMADIEQIQLLSMSDEERCVREVVASMDFIHFQAMMQSEANPRDGLQGISEPSEKAVVLWDFAW